MATNHYNFVGEGPEAVALIAKVSAAQNAANAKRLALCEAHGARGLIMDYWDASIPRGLFYTEKQNRPYLKGEEHRGERWVYYPKRSTKIGKALKAALASPDLQFSESKMILDELHLHHMTSGDRSLLFSVAGYTEDKVLVSIPVCSSVDGDAAILERVPSWFREVTQSEWDKLLDI